MPEMVGAKAIVIDDEFALTGSAYLDERNFLLNYELISAFFDPSGIELFRKWIEVKGKLAVLDII